MTPFAKAQFFTDLLSYGTISDIREVEGDRYVAVMRLMFTHAIVRGRIGDTLVFDDRWCYHGYDAAKQALDAWDGVSIAPEGWHRSPITGMRRKVLESGEVHEFYDP